MFVDASAIIAILTNEPEGEAFAGILEKIDPAKRITSVIAAWEATAGLVRKRNIPITQAEADIREFFERSGVQIVPVETDELTLALQAYDRYGRHRYPTEKRNLALNLADCFHYACAKNKRVPILHKDVGLKLTDVPSAGEPS